MLEKKKYILQQAQEKNTDSYMLTEEGIKFAKQNLNKIKNFDQSKVRIPVSKELYDNTKSRLQATEAYKKMTSNRANEISSREFNDFFRLNNYMKNAQKNEARICRMPSFKRRYSICTMFYLSKFSK